jgi:hypothetical protein
VEEFRVCKKVRRTLPVIQAAAATIGAIAALIQAVKH